MIFLLWETHKLHWAFCFNVALVDLISLGWYLFIYFGRVSIGKLFKFVGTLWVHAHENIFMAP